MQIFVSVVFFLFTFSLEAKCEFKKDVTKVVSLSGLTTTTLKELHLLEDPKLTGISVFNPISDFKKTIYPGGIFLSESALDGLNGAVVFFDESRELARLLHSRKNIISKEIKSRNFTPEEAVSRSVDILIGFIQGCEKEIANLNIKVKKLQDEILSLLPAEMNVVFYLGEFLRDRAPDMVIANDGVVKWLRSRGRIRTYPSELAYVNWSAKILNSLPANTLHVGIKDSGQTKRSELKRSSRRMTLYYQGALVPGITQLEAFHFWAKSL